MELLPGKRIVWLTTDSHLTFAKDPSEWTETEISFDLTRVAAGTELRFTHAGLVPEVECYDACSGAWSWYIDSSLRNRVNRQPSNT